jgi:hypothetical protein
MLSMAQFGREMTDDHIGRLIEEAESSAPVVSGKTHGTPRLAGALRRLADRLDPPRAHNLSKPTSDPC